MASSRRLRRWWWWRTTRRHRSGVVVVVVVAVGDVGDVGDDVVVVSPSVAICWRNPVQMLDVCQPFNPPPTHPPIARGRRLILTRKQRPAPPPMAEAGAGMAMAAATTRLPLATGQAVAWRWCRRHGTVPMRSSSTRSCRLATKSTAATASCSRRGPGDDGGSCGEQWRSILRHWRRVISSRLFLIP